MRSVRLALVAAASWLLAAGSPVLAQDGDSVRVLAWNVWHGGREDGEEVGPRKVVDVIRSSGADLVAMQETYGSGERIAEALGYEFHPRGTNVSIHSRYPVVEDISVHEEFQCAGALVELPDGDHVAFYSIWLPYSAEIWAAGTRDTDDTEAMRAACEASRVSLEAIWTAIEERLSDERYAGVPIVVAGDFNSMSHLDYGAVGFDQYHAVVDWPTSHVLSRAGFRDAYRECNPVIDRVADSTWTPRFPEQEQDRIDFVHYRARDWRATAATVIREHPEGFPSDHAAVVATLTRTPPPAGDALSLRVVSYNVCHGRGGDDVLDLDRTADVLARLRPDVVGLQEVDLRVARSGGVNQALSLAGRLSLHPAFGSFMEYQGGLYGMGILSRHPIVDVRSLRLPGGQEPRIALIADVRLPDDSLLGVVNVHFDWIADDTDRFAQANALAEHLRTFEHPYVLLGDFNDGPDSRTLACFRELASEVDKPLDASFTIPAQAPRKELDYVFVAPSERWRPASAAVVDAPLASDHLPVLAILELLVR